jgi:hypothetical protein
MLEAREMSDTDSFIIAEQSIFNSKLIESPECQYQ